MDKKTKAKVFATIELTVLYDEAGEPVSAVTGTNLNYRLSPDGVAAIARVAAAAETRWKAENGVAAEGEEA